MDCPKCTGRLHAVKFGDDITVHRCDACAGLWCKPDALERMKAEWMAEAVLDTGNPKVGDTLNEVGNIHCPEGHGLMENTSDARQRHIWFEECETCGGIFLDAGEFTDLKYESIMDRVKAFLKADRPTA